MMMLDIAVRGSLVLAVVLLTCLALRQRSAALRHAVLAAGLCAVPLVVPIGALLPAIEVDILRVADPRTPPGQAPSARGAFGERALPLTLARPSAHGAADTTTRPAATAAQIAARWPAIALGGWLLGSLVALAILIGSVVRLASATRRAAVLDDARWQAALAAATLAAGLRRPVSLRESPRRDLLATWGWRRAYLLVPSCALDWPDARIAVALAHELAHIQRRDWAWQVYASLVRAAFWWNPLAWLARQHLALESERACDDAVLALGVAPHSYAEQLIAVARALHTPRRLPAIAVPMARPSTLHRRITAMLNPRLHRATPSRLTTALLVGCVLALLVPVAVIRGAVAQAPLEGVVYDPTGAVVPEVRLALAGGGKKLEATTDAEGRFAFPGVEPGAYVLEGQLPGFHSLKQNIELRQPADWTRVITLPLGDLRETIKVTARRGSGTAPAPVGPVPVRVGGSIRPPRKLVDVKPIYPEASREAGREGDISIDAVIGRDGSVTAARVSSPEVHPELATAALTAVRQWKFSPTLLNGAPVEVVMTVSVSFKLE